jgi:hypothetical protein
VLSILAVTFAFPEEIRDWPTKLEKVDAPPLQALFVGVFASASSVLLFLWYVNVALFVAGIFSYAVLGAVRVILQRVVEHPKGIALGLSGLAAAIRGA